MAKVRAHLFISVRVHGVFFRVSTREEAQKRKLTGWVKNLPDGRVEAIVEGEEEAVQSMISWFHSGPDHAAVTDVAVKIGESRNEDWGFEIR